MRYPQRFTLDIHDEYEYGVDRRPATEEQKETESERI